MNELVKRRIRGKLHKADGSPLKNTSINCKFRRDVGNGTILIPGGDVVEKRTNNAGEYDFELYTIDDGFLNYRCEISGVKSDKFTLAAGGEISLQELFNLEQIEDVPSASILVQNLIASHELKSDPHPPYIKKVLEAEDSIPVFDDAGALHDSNIKIIENELIVGDGFLYLNEARGDERYLLQSQSAIPAFKADGSFFPLALINNGQSIPAFKSDGTEFNIALTGV